MTNTFNQVEILAPCGSYDILIAAVKAGADACYIGGNKFGARAYADNLKDDSIIAAIDYAHLHHVKLYLTVNTLLKNQEISELYEYLAPYYEAGIDAVIVQDLGVFSYIKNVFPDLPIHCSTQMNINSIHSASLMKELGASRIVTAREMSLDAIKLIKNNVDLEVESFVHGAMCYSYSGQCLMSSLAGGRSGNRGRCAQPCRKCYDDTYLLSMKDMCTLELIPKLCEAGIDSLKIEGRMKNEYYVASAVSAYKELTEDYYAGCFSYAKAKKLKDKLASIYNRGSFCDSYYFMHNGPSMISNKRPNNQGVYMGKLTSIGNGCISLKLERDMFKQDVLELVLNNKETIDVTSGISGNKGETVTLNVPKSRHILPKQDIYRTRCNKFIDDIKQDILDSTMNMPLYGEFSAIVGEPMCLTISFYDKTVTVYSDSIVEESENKPANKDNIREKLSQLGNTDYSFVDLKINLSENAFIPMSILKNLRRTALEKLENQLILDYRRKKVDYNEYILYPNNSTWDYNFSRPHIMPLYVGIINISQLKEILNYNIQGIYIQKALYDDIIREGLYDLILSKDIKIYIELPYIIDADFDIIKYVPKEACGIYIRNIDGYAAYKANYDAFSDKQVLLGASLYAYNNLAREFFLEDNISFEIPKELNLKEIASLEGKDNQLTIYEYQQVMLSAQCVIKNTIGCNKSNQIKKITDDKHNTFYARANCVECSNVIYNGVPLCIFDKLDDDFITKTKATSYRINFTIEDKKQVKEIMDGFFKGEMPLKNITTGHLQRGVE